MQQPPQPYPVRFVLDVSVMQKSIGNVKRWVEEHDNVELYIPAYTIKELHFMKRGSSLLSTNTRESIRFIEQNPARVYVEQEGEAGPSWKQCLLRQTSKPAAKDFTEDTTFKPYHIQYRQNTDRDDDHVGHGMPQMPHRLKKLIRSCIKMQDMGWSFVCEDASTKVWLASFGVAAINVSDANFMILQQSQADAKTSKQVFADKMLATQDVVVDSEAGAKTFKVKFDTTVFASRGKGKLWTP